MRLADGAEGHERVVQRGALERDPEAAGHYGHSVDVAHGARVEAEPARQGEIAAGRQPVLGPDCGVGIIVARGREIERDQPPFGRLERGAGLDDEGQIVSFLVELDPAAEVLHRSREPRSSSLDRHLGGDVRPAALDVKDIHAARDGSPGGVASVPGREARAVSGQIPHELAGVGVDAHARAGRRLSIIVKECPRLGRMGLGNIRGATSEAWGTASITWKTEKRLVRASTRLPARSTLDGKGTQTARAASKRAMMSRFSSMPATLASV